MDRAEAQWQTRTGETEDHKEALEAFVEKRTTVFKGNTCHPRLSEAQIALAI
jgi:hypothetical protein